MTVRTRYKEPSFGCSAQTLKKTRCIRDATHFHNGNSLCPVHYKQALKKLEKKGD